MQMVAGMALMKPTNFWLEFTLTPQCHWGNQPGGRRALRVGQVDFKMQIIASLGKASSIKTAVKSFITDINEERSYQRRNSGE